MIILVESQIQPAHHLLRRIRLPVQDKGVYIGIRLHDIIAVGKGRRLKLLARTGGKPKLRDGNAPDLPFGIPIFPAF